MEDNPFPIGAGLFLLTGLVMSVFFLFFARISVRRIEKEMAKKGLELCPWDTSGLRIIWCAGAIFFKGTWMDNKDDMLINRNAVNEVATKLDRFLAKGAYISTLVLCFIGAVLLIYPEFMRG